MKLFCEKWCTRRAKLTTTLVAVVLLAWLLERSFDLATAAFIGCILVTLAVGLMATRWPRKVVVSPADTPRGLADKYAVSIAALQEENPALLEAIRDSKTITIPGASSSADFFLAGRDHGAVVTSLSASATDVSGWVLMGLVGMAFSTGLGVLWVIPAGILGYALNWGLVARRLRAVSAKDGSETFPEFLSNGFSPQAALVVKLLSSLIILIFLTHYVSGQYGAAGKAMRTFFEIPYEWGVLAALGISLPYLVLAGMRGTSWSDVAQAILIAVAIICVPLAALSQVGGFPALYSQLHAIDPSLVSLTAGKTGGEAALFIIFWLSIGLAYPGQPQILTRFMAAKDDQALTRGRWIALSWFVLVAAMAVLAGLAARAGFADNPAIMQDDEQIIPALARVFLPAVLVGVVLAAVTAAIMSTADSMVLVLITTLLSDLRREKAVKLHFWSRLLAGVLVAGLAATLAVLADKKVFHVVLEAWAILGSSFAPVVFYRLWVKETSATATVAGMLSGLSSAILLGGNYQIQIVVSLLVSCAVVAVVHCLATRDTDDAVPVEAEGH